MIKKFNILSNPSYKEMYYLYIWNRLYAGFYQKHGFIVTPKANLNTSAEVVFPKSNELFDKSILSLIKKHMNCIDFPFNYDKSQYEKLEVFKNNLTFDTYNTHILKNFISKNKIALRKCTDILVPSNAKLTINIIPVNFGTVGSVFFKEELGIVMTYRYDLPISYFIRTLVLSSVNFTLKDNTDSNAYYWQNRQFLVDYLINHTIVSKFFPMVTSTEGTLKSLKQLNQLALVVQNSKEYLQSLGVLSITDLRVENNFLYLNDAEIYLTDSESIIIKYLLKNKNRVCLFTDIADELWKDDNKFSLYTLSKFISNIRKKIQASGTYSELIYTARGKGVMLKLV